MDNSTIDYVLIQGQIQYLNHIENSFSFFISPGFYSEYFLHEFVPSNEANISISRLANPDGS